MRTALLDANIFISAWLTDIVLSMDEAGLIEAHWSRGILVEARRALERMGRPPHLLDPHFDCLSALTGREVTVTRMDALPELPDRDDGHILAAAVAAGATHIITYNLFDFPTRTLAPLGITAVHPDAFLSL